MKHTDVNTHLKLEFIKPRNRDVKEDQIINPLEFISIKGVSTLGNKLSRHPIKSISLIELDKNDKPETNNNAEKLVNLSDDDHQIKINF